MKKKKSLWHKARIFLRATRRLLNIRNSSDPIGTIESICSNIAIKGYNIWILVCSALLASIGLDTNSSAVIIGAMLISPLMSPILGVGMGLGINDWDVFTLSLRNLGLATLSSLLASFVYFQITPLGEATPEILARTEPTLLDVGVALFGGIAGIVSASRKEKTNAIPGVAIATALMPPLCAAGYGLAKLDFSIFFGAFYLFFINAVFISITTFLIVRYLQFPMHREPDEKTQKTVTRVMLVSLIIVISPSIYFLYTVINRIQTVQQINSLVTEVTEDITQDNLHEVLNVERPRTNDELKSSSHIKMYISGNPVDTALTNYYQKKFQEIGDFQFSISRISNYSPDEIRRFSTENTRENFLQLETKLTTLQTRLDTAQQSLRQLKSQEVQKINTRELLSELRVFYNELDTLEIFDYRQQSPDFVMVQQVSASLAQLLAKNQGGDSDYSNFFVNWKFNQNQNFPYLALSPQLMDSLEFQNQERMNNLFDLQAYQSFPYLGFWEESPPDTSLKESRYFALRSQSAFPYTQFILKDSLAIQNFSERNQENDSNNAGNNQRDFLGPENQGPRLRRVRARFVWKDRNYRAPEDVLRNFLELKLNINPQQDSLIVEHLSQNP